MVRGAGDGALESSIASPGVLCIFPVQPIVTPQYVTKFLPMASATTRRAVWTSPIPHRLPRIRKQSRGLRGRGMATQRQLFRRIRWHVEIFA